MSPEQKAAAKQALIEKRDIESSNLEHDKRAAENARRSAEDAQRSVDRRIAKIDVLNEFIAEFSDAMSGSDLPLNGFGKYADMTTRLGILDVLGQVGSKAMIPREIARRLIAEGSKSTSKNFPTIVYAECNRLKKLGKLERSGKEFRLKQQPPPQ